MKRGKVGDSPRTNSDDARDVVSSRPPSPGLGTTGWEWLSEVHTSMSKWHSSKLRCSKWWIAPDGSP